MHELIVLIYTSVLVLCTLFKYFHIVTQLVAGSGNTDSADDGKPAEVSGAAHAEKDDGYQAGIPGPITRLFIVVNRGIANLVQDLILVSDTKNLAFCS
jgi:hypothetical protein